MRVCSLFSGIGGIDLGFIQAGFEIVRVVERKMPKVIFLENVANLLGHDDGKTFLTIYNALVPYGYSFKYQVMDALDYGNVPQRRSRIFIVAFLDHEVCDRFVFPEKVEQTVRLNDILDRSIKHDDSYYFDRTYSEYDKLKRIVKNKTLIYKFYDSIDISKSYRVCPTLLASMGNFPDSIPVILDDYGIRKITSYECLALQGYPKEFGFPNIPMASAYKQCGNSVVVPVIRKIAEQSKNTIT